MLAIVRAECFINSLCHRVHQIIIMYYDREVALFIIDYLVPSGDKQCNKNVTTDRATVAIIPRHRYRVVCALSISLDLVPRGEGMNYLDILFHLFVCLFLFSFPSIRTSVDLYLAHRYHDKSPLSINFPLSLLPMTSSSTQQRQLSRILNRRINRRVRQPILTSNCCQSKVDGHKRQNVSFII